MIREPGEGARPGALLSLLQLFEPSVDAVFDAYVLAERRRDEANRPGDAANHSEPAGVIRGANAEEDEPGAGDKDTRKRRRVPFLTGEGLDEV
jgi:hypothetical protein